jgi:hypothetical protein
MQKRKILIGDYDTAAHGWTLTGCYLSPAEQKTNFVDIPGGDGSLELSTVLTDGIPKYKDRTLTVTLECSAGTRLTRESTIKAMINQLDGMSLDIKLPDDTAHYITGLVHVAREYNDLAHAAVTLTAICKPWKWATAEKQASLTVGNETKTLTLTNSGRRPVVPTLIVSGPPIPLEFEYNGATISLTPGTYQWPELLLTPGSHTLTVTGNGGLIVKYREAVLE